jgi:hypothetical protein
MQRVFTMSLNYTLAAVQNVTEAIAAAEYWGAHWRLALAAGAKINGMVAPAMATK